MDHIDVQLMNLKNIWPEGYVVAVFMQVHWIKTDFNKWKDEDDSDYEDDTGDMDLEAVS